MSNILFVAALAFSLLPAAAGLGSYVFAEGSTLTVRTANIAFIGRSGDVITVNEEPCANATVANVDEIVLVDTSPDGGAEMGISLANGPLGPGATPETVGTSEIELTLRPGPRGDDYDSLSIGGSEAADTITAGSEGLALNDDEDVDVIVADHYKILSVSSLLHGGDDTGTGQGGHGTGGPRAEGIRFIGGDGNDSLTGSPGSDQLEGNAGADAIDGGADEAGYFGWDVADYTYSPAAVQIDLGSGTASGGDAEGDTITGVDSIFSSEFDDVLAGDDGANFFGGDTGGSDTISGRGGNDFLEGSSGADTLDGGDGFDDVEYQTSPGGVTVDLAAGTGSGSFAEGDSIMNVEGLAGSQFKDVLLGTDDVNTIQGRDGNDEIDGRGGDDLIYGDQGNDRESGGAGDDHFAQGVAGSGRDVIDGGDGSDFVEYHGRGNPIHISGDGKANDGEAGERDNVISIEEYGACDGSDRVSGGSGPDVLKGRPGNDRLTGNAGDDRLVGGPGADVLNGGPGKDTCLVSKTAGKDETIGCETVIKRNNM